MGITVSGFAQGVTKSSINGRILDNTSQPLPGANIVMLHVPSGSSYAAITDMDGFYRISNMKPGGPYKLTVSYVGFTNFEEPTLYLQLGESKNISIEMKEDKNELEEVIITGQRNNDFNSDKTGAETTISKSLIRSLPQTSRSIADFVRITPQAKISEDDDGFSISIAGQNSRYNAIYIDGAVNNDVFGLADSGTNGGQTGANPFSVDAIESFQVQAAPFDVKISGFAGGAISAITRSGTNKFEGSAYTFLRNESLAGKTPPDLVDEDSEEGRIKLDEFTSRTYGMRLGGPIIKDKLFFFVNYERGDTEIPQPFDRSNYIGDTNTAAAIQDFKNRVASTYGYDIGEFDNGLRTLLTDNFTLKLDWNINENHKVSFKNTYAKAENVELRNSSTQSLSFSNGSETFESITNSASLELSSSFGNKFANNLIVGYTLVRDDRSPQGSPFPSVRIADGLSSRDFRQGLIFGNEPFSTANLLDQDIITITNNFEIYSGRHTVTLGTHNEFASVKNLFFSFNYGDYTYLSIDDFIAGGQPSFYQRGYSLLPGDGVGDNSSGASEFGTKQFGFYVQDEVQLTDDFKFTAGLRFDLPVWEDGIANDDFNNNIIPQLEAAGKDLQGAEVGKKVSTKAHISPRIGFNWNVKGEKKTQIRGGLGIFTSRLPLVWPAATYNNNGVTGGFSRIFDFEDPIQFNPNVNNQPTHVTPGTGETGGAVDLFAPDFRLPQVLKYSIAFDQKLPWGGLIFSGDLIYNDNITAITYEQLNIRGPIGRLEGPDTRFYYDDDNIVEGYGDIILASNTGAGSSWNAAFTLKKPLQNGFQGQISYSYGDAESIFDGTSSRNISQWRNINTVNGKNRAQVSRSQFAQGHRITANVSYEFEWNENFKTTLGLFYEGSQGNPNSFIYDGALLNDNRSDNALIYIPRNRGEINLVDLVDDDTNAVILTADEQYAALDAYIENNDYLRERRGQYAERNGDFGPWSHIIDLRFTQDFALKLNGRRHALQASLDINNFTNLLNKDWGKKTFYFENTTLINAESGGPNPEFTFDPSRFQDDLEQIDDLGIQSSRWQMQIGLRYIFE